MYVLQLLYLQVCQAAGERPFPREAGRHQEDGRAQEVGRRRREQGRTGQNFVEDHGETYDL